MIKNIDQDYINDNNIPWHTSLDLLDITKRWWALHKKQPASAKEQPPVNNDGFYVKTNYLYVYKKTKGQMKDASRILYIPPLHLHSRESIYEVYKMLLKDAKMYYHGILSMLGVNATCPNEMTKLAENIITSLKLNNFECPPIERVLHEMLDTRWNLWYTYLLQYLIDISRGDFEMIPRIFSWIKNVWSIKHVQEYKFLLTMVMHNGSIVKQIQGRDSIMRRQILSPKIFMLRSQISLRFDLQPNELVVPWSMMHSMKLFINWKVDNLFDLKNPFAQPHCFTTLPDTISIALKRDPVLCKNSIIHVNRIAFADTDLFFMSSLTTVGQNADFDGDAENAKIIDNARASMEFSLTMSSEYSIYLGYLQLRLDFTETHILYMHQRSLPLQHPFHDRYNDCIDVATLTWISYDENVNAILNFRNIRQHDINIFKYVEYTKLALQLMTLSLYVDYGSTITFDFFNEINQKILEMSNNVFNDYARYNPHLPLQYIISNKVIDETLIRIGLSGSKGSFDHYLKLVESCNETHPDLSNKQYSSAASKYFNNYQCNDLRENKYTDNIQIYNNSLTSLRAIGQAAKNIPINGHESFKTIIEFNGFNFYNDSITYNDVPLFDINYEEMFFSHINFSPELCFLHFNKYFNK